MANAYWNREITWQWLHAGTSNPTKYTESYPSSTLYRLDDLQGTLL